VHIDFIEWLRHRGNWGAST
jgi:hypothetical protein